MAAPSPGSPPGASIPRASERFNHEHDGDRSVTDGESTDAPSAGAGAPRVAALPALTARIETLTSLLSSLMARMDAHTAATAAALEALSSRVDRLSAPGGLDPDVVGGIEGGIYALAGDLAEVVGGIDQLSGEIAKLRRRLPVRANNHADAERPQVAITVSAIERLGAQLGAQIADVVVARLFDVVEAIEIDAPDPPEEPSGRPAAAS